MLRSGFYIFIFALFGLLFISCGTQLPNVNYTQYQTKYSTQLSDDTLKLTVTNTIQSPIRIYLESSDSLLNLDIAQDFPVLLNAMADTQVLIISERVRLIDSLFSLDASSKLGIIKEIDTTALIFDFPFPKGRTYRIMQAYNGKFSHNSDYSKYAIDFDLIPGDTITAAADGYVVGLVKDYKHSGKTSEWRDFANYITIFHPQMNAYTQYAHFSYEGHLVQLNDFVKSGDPLAISGNTGWTSAPHLHFNVLVPAANGLQSIPCKFNTGHDGATLLDGEIVEH